MILDLPPGFIVRRAENPDDPVFESLEDMAICTHMTDECRARIEMGIALTMPPEPGERAN